MNALLASLGFLACATHLLASVDRPIRINEFVASNTSGLTDESGSTPDWIELLNQSSAPVNLDGWFLTDDPDDLTRFPLPATTLSAGGYLVVYASGRFKPTSASSETHAPFRLNKDGGNLILSQRNAFGVVEAQHRIDNYPDQKADVAYGFSEDSTKTEWVFFLNPSPGEANQGDSVAGFVQDTKFDIGRGLYSSQITVTLDCATPGASILYTLDGTLPSEGRGFRIHPASADERPSGTVTINATRCLRAQAIKPGFQPSNVDTQTYVFPSDVLAQDGIGLPYTRSANWGHAGPDWAMDPTILNHPDPEVRPIPEDVARLPIISLVMNFADMFGSNGIYIRGESVERPTSIELLNPEAHIANPNDKRGFQTEGTVQVVGGSSVNRWKSDNLSLRLKFNSDLDYPLFEDSKVSSFDTLVLDARLNNVWHYGGGVQPASQRDRAQYARDQFAADQHNAIGGLSPHGRHVWLFINGVFWGLRTLHERPDDNFAAAHMGGQNDDYEVVKHRPGTVVQGDGRHYNQLLNLTQGNLIDSAVYSSIASVLDIDDFIRYMLINYYGGNQDWAHHNWYASFNQKANDGRWRFHSWDAEKVLQDVNANLTGRNDQGGPTSIFHSLIRNPEFKLRFADLFAEYTKPGAPLSPEGAAELYRRRTEPLNLAMRLESARWGDNQRANPYTRLDWLQTRAQMLGEARNPTGNLANYFPRRTDLVRTQFRNRNWLPATQTPEFTHAPGAVNSDFQLRFNSVPAGTTIYYTTDGSDPRTPAFGGQTQQIELVAENHPKRAFVPTDASLTALWFLSNFDDRSWPQGTLGAGYESNSGYQDLIDSNLNVLTKVNGSTQETLYLRTRFDVADPERLTGLTLGMRFDDGFVAYLNGHEVARANAPGSAGNTLAWNANASASHSDGAAVQWASFDLSSFLSRLTPSNNTLAIHGLNRGTGSSDFLIWPTLTGIISEGGNPSGLNGAARRYAGPTTLPRSSTIKARAFRNGEWSAIQTATYVLDARTPRPQDLVISAIHYHPAEPTPAEIDAGFSRRADFEFLELLNRSESRLDLGQLSFSDGIGFDFKIDPVNAVIDPDERVRLASDPAAYMMRFGESIRVIGAFENDSRLSNGGEGIALISADGTFALGVAYDDAHPWPELADGRGYYLSLADLSVSNLNDPSVWTVEPGPHVGPGAYEEIMNPWRARWFEVQELTQDSIAGTFADPDGDRIVNLFEAFYGTNPKMPDEPSQLFRIEHRDDGPGVVLHVQRQDDSLHFPVLLQSSQDLETWQEGPTIARPNMNPRSIVIEGFGADPQEAPRYFRLALP